MNRTNFIRVSTVVFLVVAALHFYRAINGLTLKLGAWVIPVEWSWVAVLVALFLCYSGYKNWR